VAGAQADNVIGLVYVAAFIPDAGESFEEIFAGFPPTAILEAVRPLNYPAPDGGTAVELTIAPELHRHPFAAGLPESETVPLAVMQRPFGDVFAQRAQVAAWKSLPSWAVVATSDQAIHPDAQRHMTARAGADTIEVDASHSIALSQPDAVTEL